MELTITDGGRTNVSCISDSNHDASARATANLTFKLTPRHVLLLLCLLSRFNSFVFLTVASNGPVSTIEAISLSSPPVPALP